MSPRNRQNGIRYNLSQLNKPLRDKNYQTQQQKDERNLGYVYCENPDHRSVDCKTVATVDDRRNVLSNKRLCFNCTGSKHRAVDCKTRSLGQTCHTKHYTSICNSVGNQLMTATSTEKPAVTYSVAVVEVPGLKCRALLDTGAKSSYALSGVTRSVKDRSSSARNVIDGNDDRSGYQAGRDHQGPDKFATERFPNRNRSDQSRTALAGKPSLPPGPGKVRPLNGSEDKRCGH